MLTSRSTALLEVQVFENTNIFPKLEYGKTNQDYEPLLDRILYNELMEYGEDSMSKMNININNNCLCGYQMNILEAA